VIKIYSIQLYESLRLYNNSIPNKNVKLSSLKINPKDITD